MKKLASIIISLVYLLLSTGVVLNVHYCRGEIESVSLIVEVQKCSCHSEISDNNCCSNYQYFLQLDLDEQLVENTRSVSEVFKYIKLLEKDEYDFEVYYTESQDYFYPDISPPPKLAIWKTNCSFLFYG
jgi:hypothetical protein